MNKTCRILALALALVMLLGLGSAAFAEDDAVVIE